MKFGLLILVGAWCAAGSAFAAESVPAQASGSATISAGSKIPPMTQLLQQGFDIKAAFVDSSGVAYIALQNKTSAYLCHSGAVPACDKLN